MRRFWLAVSLLTVATACGTDGRTEVRAQRPASATAGPEASEPAPTPTLEPPPPVKVSAGETVFDLQPWSYCYRNGCVDGMPPSPLPDLGVADEVAVEFPLPDWTFTATFAPSGVLCPRQQSVSLVGTGAGAFRLLPAGHAGTYDVTLFGKGNGDLSVSFRWTTTRDGDLPTPEARLALIADHDGEPDSYGVELMLSNLATTPHDAAAVITVRSANGDQLTFTPTQAQDCIAEGTVYWDGPDDRGKAAAALGPPPFTYDVEVVLDGERYHAQATWPNDEIDGNEPSVALSFVPPLPAQQ